MRPVVLLVPLLCACGALDADGDLLTDALERTWGTDPRDPDSDADGLDDGAEVHFHFTDPTKPDSDADKALDGWEISVGLDPLDAYERAYDAGWPHLDVASKRELLRSRAPSLLEVGAPVKNFSLWHQNDQQFELYDLAKTDKPVVLLVTASGSLRLTLEWAYGNHTSADYPAHLSSSLNAGEWWLVVVYTEDATDQAATLASLEARYQPKELDPDNLVVLLDHGFSVWGHFNLLDSDAEDSRRVDYAHFAVLNQNMVVRGIDDWAVLDALLAE